MTFKSYIWNHFQKLIENDIKKARCKHYQRIYFFPKGSGMGHLKIHLEKSHSPNEP